MTPRIQVAFDTTSTARALRVLEKTAPDIDIIEAGTVLCLSEGLGAVTKLRAAYPDHPLVADIRIARAGKKFADMAFAAGATIVTVIGETDPDVVAGASRAATEHGGHVEVELGSSWTPDDVTRWVDLNVSNLIVHRPIGLSSLDDNGTRATLARLGDCDLGSTQITLAGGLTPDGMHYFAGYPIDVVVVGSAVVDAEHPHAALQKFAESLSDLRTS